VQRLRVVEHLPITFVDDSRLNTATLCVDRFGVDIICVALDVPPSASSLRNAPPSASSLRNAPPSASSPRNACALLSGSSNRCYSSMSSFCAFNLLAGELARFGTGPFVCWRVVGVVISVRRRSVDWLGRVVGHARTAPRIGRHLMRDNFIEFASGSKSARSNSSALLGCLCIAPALTMVVTSARRRSVDWLGTLKERAHCVRRHRIHL